MQKTREPACTRHGNRQPRASRSHECLDALSVHSLRGFRTLLRTTRPSTACCIALRQHYAEVWAQSNSSACHGFFFFYELNICSSEDYGKNMEKHAKKAHGGVKNAGRGRAVNCAANCADQCEQNLSNELCSFPDELDFRKKSSARALYYSSQPCKCVGAGGQSRATSNSLLALEVTPSFLRTSRFR